jgi:hypothetical protein
VETQKAQRAANPRAAAAQDARRDDPPWEP